MDLERGPALLAQLQRPGANVALAPVRLSWGGDPAAAYDSDVAEVFARMLRRPDFHAQAACRGMDVNEFVPSSGKPSDAARSVCGGCSVVDECRDAGRGEVGVWGGRVQTLKVRRPTATEWRRRRAKAVAALPPSKRDARWWMPR